MTAAASFPASYVQGWEAPPAIVVGNTPAALSRAARTVETSGLRVAAQLLSDAALDRIDSQVRTGLLWAEFDRELSAEDERLLERIDADAAAGRYPAVLSGPLRLVDRLFERSPRGGAELLVDASELDRAAALALAQSDARKTTSVADVASDQSAARLRQLSEEVSRIASTLARLSGESGPSEVKPGTEAPPTGEIPSVPAETVRSVIRARRERAKYLPADLFADPAWDMLLDLLQAEIVQHRVPVSSLCIAAAVPATTALRWIKSMTDRGLLTRRADPHDGRRIFIEMSRPTSLAVRRFFAEVGTAAV